MTMDSRLICQIELNFQLQLITASFVMENAGIDPEPVILNMIDRHRKMYQEQAEVYMAKHSSSFFPPDEHVLEQFKSVDEWLTELRVNLRSIMKNDDD